MSKVPITKILAIFATTLAIGVPLGPKLHAQNKDGPILISIVAEVYQTKRTIAEPLLRGDHVDAVQLIAALQKLTQGFNSTTTITKLPALTTKSGQRSLVTGKDVTLEAEPVLGADAQTVSLHAALTVGEKQLLTSADAKFGGTVFLGSFDGPTPDSVQLAFIHLLRQ